MDSIRWTLHSTHTMLLDSANKASDPRRSMRVRLLSYRLEITLRSRGAPESERTVLLLILLATHTNLKGRINYVVF